MRDIILFTKERLPTEKSIHILTDSIKNGKRNGENGFMIEKPSSLFLEFQNEPISDAPDFDFSDKEKKKICAFLLQTTVSSTISNTTVHLMSVVYWKPCFPLFPRFICSSTKKEKTAVIVRRKNT